jgi:hypothetical protein
MIRLELPWLPPSSNHAYMNNGFGGRTLSTEGKKFKRETTAHFAQRYPREMRFFKANLPYLLVMRFFFEDLENKGFATGKTETRYKKFDGGNRTKLLEDALKDAGGIDDSQTLTSIWSKERGSPERTVLWAWSLEEEESPFDAPLRNLP